MILDRFGLSGKVAIVTGAGRGIGRGVALGLAEAGADVVCVARTLMQVEEVAGCIRSLGRRAIAVQCDVSETAHIPRVVEAAAAEFGHVDILVNNAGGWPPSSVMKTTEASFEEAFRFNVLSGFTLGKLAIPHMRAGRGVILNISSALSHLVEKPFVVYGTCKAALNHMTRLMAYELAPAIRVNALAVGAVETSALTPFIDTGNLREKMQSMTPLGRIGEPQDVACAALYLCSDAGSWVTGKVFEVDGGTVASNWPLDMMALGM